MPRCLVTGANGYIGRELCRQLLAADVDVVALVRDKRTAPSGTQALVADLASRIPDARELDGIDVVFHLAGIAHQRSTAEAYARINFDATWMLARAAADAGVGTFLFTSSIKAMGEAPSAAPRTEERISEQRDEYGLSKWRAEEALRREFARTEMAVVILRPCLVYDADASGNLGALARAAQRGLPMPPELGARSMISREDLVAVMLDFLQRPSRGVHTYIVCDGDSYSSRRIYRALRRAAGRGDTMSLPLWLWRIACVGLDVSARLDSRDSYRRLFGTELYDARKLRAERGWQPQLNLEQALGVANH
ncbi:MAG: NAD-dependent epimerase/dehydratase family protein [Pseudomonadota bacterium]